AAELVEVVRLLNDAARIVDERVGVHRLIAIEPECAAVQIVRAGLGDDIDDAAAGAAGLGVVAAVIDLEFLNRILAEGVRIANALPSAGLPEKEVIPVGAVDQEAVGGAALSGEREIAAARVSDYT